MNLDKLDAAKARPMRDGSPGFVVDGHNEGEMARLRPLRDGVYALAAISAPGTFPVEIELDAETLRSFIEHARWMVDGPADENAPSGEAGERSDTKNASDLGGPA